MNSTGSFQPSCLKSTMVQSPFCVRSKLIFVPAHSSGPSNALQARGRAGLKLETLKVKTAGIKAELEHAADLALPLRVGRPPRGKTFDRGQGPVDITRGRRLDSDFMQNIGH